MRSQSSPEYGPDSECVPVRRHAAPGSRRMRAAVWPRTASTAARADSADWEE